MNIPTELSGSPLEGDTYFFRLASDQNLNKTCVLCSCGGGWNFDTVLYSSSSSLGLTARKRSLLLSRDFFLVFNKICYSRAKTVSLSPPTPEH